ncbi:uncharacterized protein si:dkey-1h24.6 isoform X2 [Triplophysa dalaica]|uniref:uncharacterized protein si:dkey-1h24.6 isoform X2 n=1 Tax=Triplophysa dalaica TaxID=1582913 RepID=UPI0024E00051|nr:uncharacterized protein si:dkey-1h24.6 isoform X2 [Triplophysa dalaica]
MRLQQMKTFVILLSLCLFHNALTKPQSNLPAVKYVALNNNVSVACPSLSGTEMDFKLYKGPDEVNSIYINVNNTLDSKHSDSSKNDFPSILSANFTDGSANFILFNLTVNITGLYTCEAVRNFPPPFLKVEQMPQTIVFVEETPRIQFCQQDMYLVLWGVLGVLGIYGVLMSCVVLRLLINRNIRECRKKWQGVQHPTLQNFCIDTVG